MSERVEQRLADLLGHPQFDPYGNPIPGLPEIGEPAAPVTFLEGVDSVVHLVERTGGPVSGTLSRLGEPLQTDVELLGRMSELGLLPGHEVVATAGRGVITLAAPGGVSVLDLPTDVARHVFLATS